MSGPAGAPRWEPATELEAGLAEALRAGDLAAAGRLLSAAEVLLPITAAAAEGREPVSWAVVPVAGRRCVPAFTSVPALLTGTHQQARHYRVTAVRDLIAGWPDPDCLLLLDPLTPLQIHLAVTELGPLVAVPVVDALDHPGDAAAAACGTVLQKLLSAGEAHALLARDEATASGYALRLEEIAHLDTLDALVAGLPLSRLDPDLGAAPAEIYLLRWLAVGAPLYPMATERCVTGGTGFLPGVEPAVQVHRLPGVSLPHGAELLRVTGPGRSTPQLLACYDADERSWTQGTDPAMATGPAVVLPCYRARWQGLHYEASPCLAGGRLAIRLYRSHPGDGFEPVCADRYRRVVPVQEVAELHHAVAVCTWSSEPFRVLARSEADEMLLEYAGDDPAAPDRLGLSAAGWGVHRTWIPAAGVQPTVATTRLR